MCIDNYKQLTDVFAINYYCQFVQFNYNEVFLSVG